MRHERKHMVQRLTGRTDPGRSILGTLALAALLVFAALPAAAQDRAEITVFGGYTASEGVNVSVSNDAGDFIDKVNTPGGAAFGAAVHFWLSPNVQLGGHFGSQSSSLDLQGSSDLELTGMTINNYHGILTWHWGSSNSSMRPFFQFGLGATHYLPSELELNPLDPGYSVGGTSIDSEVKFSGTLGGGVKFYTSEKVGFSLGARWTPTYIKSDPGGMYCSPYWGPWWGPSCVVLSDTDYSNQYEFTAGIIFRL